MTGKELVRRLRAEGWRLDRIHGSHHIFIKNAKTVVVPVHGNHDLPKGTLNAILKAAGLK